MFLRMRNLSPDPGLRTEKAGTQPTRNDMMAFAGRLLARREYAVAELENRLMRKWAGAEDLEQHIAEVISDLQADGALSDTRFAEAYTRMRRNRFTGPLKIRADLRQRGVPETVIAEALQPLEDEWVGLAMAWLGQQTREPLDFSARAKYYRRLINRGFSHQHAMDALAGASQS